MEISIKSFKLKIKFSFILILCTALVFGADNALWFLLFSVFHECGHIFALYLFGAKIECLTLSCCGAALKYENRISPWQEAFVALAGPVVNLVLFTVLKDDINLLLFILNMLPIYPLDGGRALKIFLPRTQPVLGFAFLVLLTICSAYILIEFKIFGLFAVCIYLWMVNLRLI
ncbi:MAG: hypothetical protein EGQ91_07480 [Clostridiales bacterium]|nr:hypothetical protein [Clostridiales bacterium]